ncbi:hypothetical protein [Streptomyces prunicolor]|jgi:hypothetical protein|uniref:LPXTG cell wall anchor domain-containing protein n=1 Tax=Streptomyces prunicolor TaxID=67348 RepID=A0ABU4FQS8_9ACTN|nr:hypothetical protein [Streptomyces prunicolor]MCX5234587.1 hypothetical protein [Streptomyces prunicolor]MDV7222390.1 hypothetical protein [Streptomyces prunicolor]
MGKLILKIIGVLVVFGLALAALGGSAGEIEVIGWGILLIGSLVYVVTRHRRSLQDR